MGNKALTTGNDARAPETARADGGLMEGVMRRGMVDNAKARPSASKISGDGSEQKREDRGQRDAGGGRESEGGQKGTGGGHRGGPEETGSGDGQGDKERTGGVHRG